MLRFADFYADRRQTTDKPIALPPATRARTQGNYTQMYVLVTNFSIPIIIIVHFVCSFPSTCSWINCHKLPFFLPLGAICSLALSAFIALCFLHISRHNYPGGVAFSRLHQLADQHTEEKIGKQFSCTLDESTLGICRAQAPQRKIN